MTHDTQHGREAPDPWSYPTQQAYERARDAWEAEVAEKVPAWTEEDRTVLEARVRRAQEGR